MAARRKLVSEDADDYDIAGSAAEMAAFRKRLSSIDMTTLRDQLNGGAISRKWKRVLVQAEYARRTGEDPDEETGSRSIRRRLKTERWGRWTASIIIVTCCLILVYTFYQFL